jgi:hypothetical protein
MIDLKSAAGSNIFHRHASIREDIPLDWYDPCECRNTSSLTPEYIVNIFQQPLLTTMAISSIIFHRDPKVRGGVPLN